MRPRTLRHRLALVGTGAFLAAAALGQCAPPANATPMSYLQALNNRGITVYDTTSMLTTGYAVCGTLDDHNGADVVRAVYLHYSDVTSIDMAQRIVVSAVEELCPWHDHRGEVLA